MKIILKSLARGPPRGPQRTTYVRPATSWLARGPHFADPWYNV